MAAQQSSFTMASSPGPGSPACHKGSTVQNALSGAAIAGKAPGGQAQEDESQLIACDGFGLLTVNVSSVNRRGPCWLVTGAGQYPYPPLLLLPGLLCATGAAAPEAGTTCST